MDAMKDDDFLAEVREKFDRASDAEDKNRKRFADNIRFSRMREQWDPDILRDRELRGLPCLTFDHTNIFVRQVVNSARQNRPSIQVVPADSNSDKETAEIMSGLIRNIEVSSNADIAYDTAVENAVGGAFGYFRVNLSYTSDDSFDKDLTIEPIADPLTVYGDPDAESFDGSDWNCCFVVRRIPEDEYKREYGDKAKSDFADIKELGAPWYDDECITIAEYWHREQVESQIIALSNDTVVSLDEYKERAEEYAQLQIEPVGEPRAVRSHKVTQYVVNGSEVLEKVDWPGRYIPIIPVYGDVVVLDGERHFYSLIDGAKDAQQNHNYWESCITGAIALAPVSPFIGPVGAFDTDIEKWSNINDPSIATVEYDGPVRPSREPPPAYQGAMIERAKSAVDEMKAIIGLHSPNLGERSGAESGVAIRQLQRQGDVATFHFMDNLTRSIRHAGRILIDLIGKVYTTPRVLRVLGEDMEPQPVQTAPADMQQQLMMQAMQRGQDIGRIYDLTAGKYDLVVKAGPSFGTQREYAQAEIVEIIRAFPPSAPVLGPMYLDNSDWPGASDAADQLRALNGAQEGGGGEAMQQQMQQQVQAAVQQLQGQIQQLAQENAELKQAAALKAEELRIKGFEAETRRFEAQAKAESDARAAQAKNAEVMLDAYEKSNPFEVEGL